MFCYSFRPNVCRALGLSGKGKFYISPMWCSTLLARSVIFCEFHEINLISSIMVFPGSGIFFPSLLQREVLEDPLLRGLERERERPWAPHVPLVWCKTTWHCSMPGLRRGVSQPTLVGEVAACQTPRLHKTTPPRVWLLHAKSQVA